MTDSGPQKARVKGKWICREAPRAWWDSPTPLKPLGERHEIKHKSHHLWGVHEELKYLSFSEKAFRRLLYDNLGHQGYRQLGRRMREKGFFFWSLAGGALEQWKEAEVRDPKSQPKCAWRIQLRGLFTSTVAASAIKSPRSRPMSVKNVLPGTFIKIPHHPSSLTAFIQAPVNVNTLRIPSPETNSTDFSQL